MPITTNISFEQCLKAAEWWGEFLVTADQVAPSAAKDWKGYSFVSPAAKEKFVQMLAELLYSKAEEEGVKSGPDHAVKIGHGSVHHPPGEVTFVLEKAGLKKYESDMPWGMEVIVQPNGVIDFHKPDGRHEYLYAGKGSAPIPVESYDIEAERVATAPLVMVRGEQWLYRPVRKGERYTTMHMEKGKAVEWTERASSDGFVFAHGKGDPTELVNNRDAFNFILYTTPEANLYEAFSAPKEARTRSRNSEFGHFPSAPNWRQNDGEGHLVEWEGPVKLVRLRREDRVLDRGSHMGAIIGEAGDFVLVDPITQNKKLLTRETIRQWGYELYRCDEQGNLKTPNKPLVSASAAKAHDA